jgi:prevent-host-death family protein
MKTVKIAELKDRLSYHLRAVEAGDQVEVTDRNRPIARIVPIERRSGAVVRPPARSFAAIRDRAYPPADPGIDSTALLAQERQGR